MTSVLTRFDWAGIGPLRLRARALAEGVYAGAHRSARRGAGIEFGGYRAYVPGDDLRMLDRRALLRHDRLVVRQFETETDRALRLVVDATPSMGYRGARAPGSKLELATVLAAALARLAVRAGDPVGLAFAGGEAARGVPVSGGRECFDRVVSALDAVRPGGDATVDPEGALRPVEALRGARRGSVLVVLSDLLDLPGAAHERIAELATRGRVLVVVEVLAPEEREFSFDGPVRLRALEGGAVVESDAEAKEAYLAALEAQRASYREAVAARGGAVVPVLTTDDPVQALRRVVAAIR